MEGVVKHGTQRIKAGIIEVTGDNFLGIIEEALINKGYDIDIEPQNNDFHRPQGVKINVYEVRSYER